ncbi:MAG: hypothetical protein QOK49_3650 [Baekduia sp.]|nr:hypothetical protein [Baekduia sp.]
MTLRPSDGVATCGECGAPLAGDQRYCLECGARHGAPRVDPFATLGFPSERPHAVEAPAGPVARRTPSPRISAALAAATLGVGGLIGAALGPGPAPSVAAAPQRLVALVVPGASATKATPADTTSNATPPPVTRGDARTPSARDSAATTATDPTSTAGATGTGAATKTTTSTTTSTSTSTTGDGPGSTTPATAVPAGTAPAHVWLISVTQLNTSAYAPGGPFADLTGQGTLLSNYTAAAPSAAANEIALLGGQVPTADCDADPTACVLPAGETSLPDQLVSFNLTWKAYVEDATLRCATAPSPRVATSLFTTLRRRDDCAATTAGLDALDADLKDAARTPAFSLLVPADPTASLHDLVARITASEAYKSDGVLVIASDAHPPTGDPNAPLGALVLSPRATAGKVLDAATGPVALLRSFDALLGLDPLAGAAQAPAGALDGVLAAASLSAPTTSTPSTTSTTTTRSSP